MPEPDQPPQDHAAEEAVLPPDEHYYVWKNFVDPDDEDGEGERYLVTPRSGAGEAREPIDYHFRNTEAAIKWLSSAVAMDEVALEEAATFVLVSTTLTPVAWALPMLKVKPGDGPQGGEASPNRLVQ